YYLQLLKSDEYIHLVKDAIKSDVEAQSSYVGIPPKTLLTGLNDQLLNAQLNEYMINTADYLNFKSDYTKPNYPADIFIPALKSFLDADAKTNNYVPTTEQYSLLNEVAKDTSKIIEKHIDLFQLELFKEASSFNKLHEHIYNISNHGLCVLWGWLFAISCLFFLHYHQLKKWLLYQFTSFWIVGSLISIPAIVLILFNLVQRLSIDTPYIKYAFEILLTSFIGHFLNWGLLFFLLSSMGLIYRIYRKNSLTAL
ncbi:MAG: hypothetical protein J7L77_02285, partial [Clostridiales bacterium]|nr:hypothetical protein [Clostridiales bacterium]